MSKYLNSSSCLFSDKKIYISKMELKEAFQKLISLCADIEKFSAKQ
jgi:hypothetical protein